jgi:cell division protein FtsL
VNTFSYVHVSLSVPVCALTGRAAQRKRKIQELTEGIAAERARIKQLKKEVEDAQKGREDSVHDTTTAKRLSP